MHEVCHLLYYNQNKSSRKIVNEAFDKSTSISSSYAKRLFDEAVATSIGNGFVYEKLSGKKPTGSWYFHKYINEMAKIIYPLIKRYIEKEIPIDTEFIKEYINLYDKKWLGEPKNLMTYHSILASNKNIVNSLRSKFRYGNIYDDLTPIKKENLIQLKSRKLTKIIIINNNNDLNIEMVKSVFFKVKMDLSASKDFIYSSFLEDKTQLIIINIASNNAEEKMLKNFVEIKNLGLKENLIIY